MKDIGQMAWEDAEKAVPKRPIERIVLVCPTCERQLSSGLVVAETMTCDCGQVIRLLERPYCEGKQHCEGTRP